MRAFDLVVIALLIYFVSELALWQEHRQNIPPCTPTTEVSNNATYRL